MFQHALICTDLTDSMSRFARVIPGLAAGGLRRIVFFHNVPIETERSVPRIDEEAIAASRQQLESLIANAPAEVQVVVEVASGRPTDNILKLVKAHAIDIIFLGMPTRNLLAEKLFGSTTMELAERTPVPLMILRPQLVSTYTTEELTLRCRNLFRNLLIPYDGSRGAQHLIESLQHQVNESSESVLESCLLLKVIDEGMREELRGDTPIKTAEAQLSAVGKVLNPLGVKVETLVRTGEPLNEILSVAELYDISAIAACSGNINRLLGWSVPSLTRDILRQSWHPVLYFPKPKS